MNEQQGYKWWKEPRRQLTPSEKQALTLETQMQQISLSDLDAILAALDFGTCIDVLPVPFVQCSPPRLTLQQRHERSLFEEKIASISRVSKPCRTRGSRGLAANHPARCAVKVSGPSAILPSTSRQGTTSKGNDDAQIDRALSRPSYRWAVASSAAKFVHSVQVCHSRDGVAFSLDLSESQELRTNVAVDPVRAFARRFQRAFESLGFPCPPFLLEVEIARSGKTHFHGAMIPGQIRREILVRALMKAGGKVHGRSASRQVKLKPIYEATGWMSYITEDAEITERRLEISRTTYLSDDLRRMSEAAWKYI